jgi:hypothetical protein
MLVFIWTILLAPSSLHMQMIPLDLYGTSWQTKHLLQEAIAARVLESAMMKVRYALGQRWRVEVDVLYLQPGNRLLWLLFVRLVFMYDDG